MLFNFALMFILHSLKRGKLPYYITNAYCLNNNLKNNSHPYMEVSYVVEFTADCKPEKPRTLVI